MLKLGKSKPWPEALEKLTSQRTMDVGPMKEYFWPLYLWLRAQRCASNYTIGWPENPGPTYDPCVVPTTLPDTDSQTTPADSQTTPANNQTNKVAAHARSLNTAGTLIIAMFFALVGF